MWQQNSENIESTSINSIKDRYKRCDILSGNIKNKLVKKV